VWLVSLLDCRVHARAVVCNKAPKGRKGVET
jgi:hypothetical protein